MIGMRSDREWLMTRGLRNCRFIAIDYISRLDKQGGPNLRTKVSLVGPSQHGSSWSPKCGSKQHAVVNNDHSVV